LCHGWELYIPCGESGLGEIGVSEGLDKNFAQVAYRGFQPLKTTKGGQPHLWWCKRGQPAQLSNSVFALTLSTGQNTFVLPDFPELKAELDNHIRVKLRRKMDARDSVVSQVRQHTQHEGLIQRYKQLGPDGKVVEEGFEVLSTEFVTSVDEIPTLVGNNLEKKLDEIAEKTAANLAAAFYKKVGEVCQEAGNSMNAGGQPLSAEHVLQMMDKVEMEFDQTGKPTTQIVFHPNMTESFKKVAEQIENDPELKRRTDAILARKREAWAARESNRKLVD
jgi:hypothetical protein